MASSDDGDGDSRLAPEMIVPFVGGPVLASALPPIPVPLKQN